MNFEYSEEQTMIKDSVERFVREEYGFDVRRQIIASDDGYSREYWAKFAELGWLSIPFAEQYGGYGGSVDDVAAIMEALGKGNVVEPIVPTVLMFGGLLAHSGNEALMSAYIPRIIAGECLGAFAYLERQSRFEMTDIATTARPERDKLIINGEKTVVLNGTNADSLVVAVRTGGEQFDRRGISLIVVDTDTPGVEVTGYAMMDGQRAANIKFVDVAVAKDCLLGALDEGMDVVDKMVPEALLALCAQAQGIMETLNETTVNYTKTRNQFGVPISSFQVLQHRMVDNFMAAEQARSMLYRGLCAFGSGSVETKYERSRSLHALKAVAAKSSKLIGEEAIQIHGGMGMTDELDVGHFVKRLMTINTMFGDGDYHQKAFNRLSYQSAS